MRNFIIFFEGHEGTSPLVRLLNNFEEISIVHQANESGWEPFDIHNCGAIPLPTFELCLNLAFKQPRAARRLSKIYNRTATSPLAEVKKNAALGFKMRFHAPVRGSKYIPRFPRWYRLSKRLFHRRDHLTFKERMIGVLKRNHVTVFLAVRQNVLKWALSKYHGDGTGNPGHLQFLLASGELRREEIPRIRVDCAALEKIIIECEESHKWKLNLMQELQRERIPTYPLRYEDFLMDNVKYLKRLFGILQLEISGEAINAALKQGMYFEKVHSDDISTFVENHEEIMEKFGNRFVGWP